MPEKSKTTATKGNTANNEGISEGKKRRLANLKPFKPGQSGNPAGRPKKLLTEAYHAILSKKFPGDPKKRTFAELIAESMAKEAIKGKPQAAIEIADRTEGKTTQAHELSGPRGAPISVQSRTPQQIEERISELLAKGGFKTT
jgi:Family of unknown function (DUF5681)